MKITQISAFLSVHPFDIVCLSETFLDSSIGDEGPRLVLDGYSLIRCDHPSDSRRGGVCIYYKDHPSLVERPEMTTFNECLVCKVKSGSSRLLLGHCYRSPSQDSDQFDLFKQKWEQTIQNIYDCSPTASIFIGDFNARNSDWWAGDTTTTQGNDLSEISAQYDLHQIIDGPTHILPNSSSCIDLIFSSTTAFVSESGILPSLHPRCHHQVVFTKLNFKVRFPPAYQRRIWDFNRANPETIKRALDGINWEMVFHDLNVDGRVSFLTDCILNVFRNLIPNKIITIRSKDTLWMTPVIKRMILDKAKIYRR